jgi:1-phosphofructokinase
MRIDENPRAFVLDPSPLLTVTVEAGDEGDEIHLHAGGQGYWVAHLIEALEVRVCLCAAFGGETGKVVRTLVEDDITTLRAVTRPGDNGAYVHDRRQGERVQVAETAPKPLSRHAVDELYGAALVAGLEADVCVLGGPGKWSPPVVPADFYRRLAGDLRANQKPVVADLSGEPLDCALEGGIDVLKVSHEELLADGRAKEDSVAALVAAMEELRQAGAEHVVLSRAEEPALALVGGEVVELHHPRLEPVDPRGAGDAMTAGLAAGLARAEPMDGALRLAAAAGALNVARRGLATGDRREIERLAEHVELRALQGRKG